MVRLYDGKEDGGDAGQTEARLDGFLKQFCAVNVVTGETGSDQTRPEQQRSHDSREILK